MSFKYKNIWRVSYTSILKDFLNHDFALKPEVKERYIVTGLTDVILLEAELKSTYGNDVIIELKSAEWLGRGFQDKNDD